MYRLKRFLLIYTIAVVFTSLLVISGLCAGSASNSARSESPKMDIKWSEITNPFLDTEPEFSLRDPMLFYHNGVFHCYYSIVEHKEGEYCFYLGYTKSKDLIHWSKSKQLTTSKLGFSSPGNIIRYGDEWIMSLQTYPIQPGEHIASEDARLWTMKSKDLVNWSEPVQMNPNGAQVNWSQSHRQIDPCFAEYNGKWHCLYKTSGAFGLLITDDFKEWREASPDRPVLCKAEWPGKATIENPCVFREGDEYVLVFAPCRTGRGIGIARSKDLQHWYDAHMLSFPNLPWTDNGPSAAMVADLRDVCGKYVMVFHGERKKINSHAAALGIAWSDDLEHWTVPGSN